MSHTENKSNTAAPEGALTRRDWLMTFGSAVVLSGFRGFPPSPLQHLQAAGAALPPGLYEPSLDHLTHVLGTQGLLVTIPAGSETEYTRPRSGPFVPQAFSPDEFRILRRLVEIILGDDLKNAPEKAASGGPATIWDEVAEWIDLVVASAPGVRNAARNLPPDQRTLAVAYFGGEEPVRELETFEPERLCREGIAWLAGESQKQFAKFFLEAGSSAQTQLVQQISDARPDLSATNVGTRFFDFLKAECVRGFYTSRAGLKELDYKGNAFYAKSPGCERTP